MKILIIFGVMIVLLLLLFIYSACVVSSRCSRIEEQELEKFKEENLWKITKKKILKKI